MAVQRASTVAFRLSAGVVAQLMFDDVVQDHVKGRMWTPSKEPLDLPRVRNTADHILKPGGCTPRRTAR